MGEDAKKFGESGDMSQAQIEVGAKIMAICQRSGLKPQESVEMLRELAQTLQEVIDKGYEERHGGTKHMDLVGGYL